MVGKQRKEFSPSGCGWISLVSFLNISLWKHFDNSGATAIWNSSLPSSSPSASHFQSPCPGRPPRSLPPSSCTSQCCSSSPGDWDWPQSRCEQLTLPSAAFLTGMDEEKSVIKVYQRRTGVLLQNNVVIWIIIWTITVEKLSILQLWLQLMCTSTSTNEKWLFIRLSQTLTTAWGAAYLVVRDLQEVVGVARAEFIFYVWRNRELPCKGDRASNAEL